MALAQKHVWKPMEQNRTPRYYSKQLCLPNFSQSHQRH
jgi:hypothetical protein